MDQCVPTNIDMRAELVQRLGSQLPHLSRRQLEIVWHLVDGLSEKQIANALGISQNTVHVHMKLLYLRCGVRSRGELLGGIIKGILGLRCSNG